MYSRIVYVAGPYRATTEWQVKQNIGLAEAAMSVLLKKGWFVICPHKNSAHMGGVIFLDPEEDHAMWIAGDCAILRRLNPHRDALYLLPGWENSKGARTEREVAGLCGLTTYERMDDVPDLTV